MRPVAILASGMVTAVGLNAPSACAAIRCAIDNFTETRFMDKGGEWIIGAQVPLEQPWRGLPKLVRMVVPAIQECLEQIGSSDTREIPLLLCVAEPERPGRIDGLDEALLEQVTRELGQQFHPEFTAVIARGRVAGGLALSAARQLLYDQHVPYCIIAGVDSYLSAATLGGYEEKRRLLTSQNSNGFIPGEAAAAVLVGMPKRKQSGPKDLICLGIGVGQEKATFDSDEPLRADGLLEAYRTALSDADVGFEAVDFRLCDANGEQYWFKEAALAMTRAMRVRKPEFDIWHPADCIGETGAAAGPAALGVALAASRKSYAPGPGALCHLGGDDGTRHAFVLRSQE